MERRVHPLLANEGPLSLLGRLRAALRVHRRSPRTEDAYVRWVKRYVRFHNRRHPRELGAADVTAFLTDLAVRERVSASTQNQALGAILFLYRHVIRQPMPWVHDVVRAQRSQHLPTVLSRTEVDAVLGELSGVARLVALLLYGSGLRIAEALALRVKDLNLERGLVTVRAGKGGKDRTTVLPRSSVVPLRAHLAHVYWRHLQDLREDVTVHLPDALVRKVPAGGRAFGWWWVFPASRTYVDRATGRRMRHHYHESAVQRAVTAAGPRARVTQRVTCHAFRHSFATHLLEDGYDIRTIQELLGHTDVRTTMIYMHVLRPGGRPVESPADRVQPSPSSHGGGRVV